ncbi:hypothetical protein OAA84_02920 [Amylibacter sp.]|nr:hypothetical protein [Amylibacter sp.]
MAATQPMLRIVSTFKSYRLMWLGRTQETNHAKHLTNKIEI